MGSRLPAFISKRGLINGLRLYWHFKSKSKAAIRLPWLQQPVYFRGIESDARMFEQLFINNEYDVPVNFQPKTIIDLGANVGYAALFYANKYPQATIFSVEPDTDNHAIAAKNTTPYKNVQLVKGAVWHEAALINLVDNGYGEAGYMVETGKGPNTIKAYTITEIMQQLNTAIIDILKIDVEGTEKELFENNYQYWLPRTRLLIVETHDRYKKGTSKAVFKAISEYNFSLELSGENLVLYNNDLNA
jgi:FkbM family methyltransferase